MFFNYKMSDRIDSISPTKKRKVDVQLVEKEVRFNRKGKLSTVLTDDYKPYQEIIINTYFIQ